MISQSRNVFLITKEQYAFIFWFVYFFIFSKNLILWLKWENTFFLCKSWPNQLSIVKSSKEHSRGSPQFPYQSWGKSFHDVLIGKQTNRQTDKQRLQLYIYLYRWRIAGLGVTRLLLRYIPDQMWKRGNMDR